MKSLNLSAAMAHWGYVAPLLTTPQTAAQYKALVEALDSILDAGGADEANPLASLAVFVGDLVAQWEARRNPMPTDATTPASRLAFLMQQHGLRQCDLPEVGNQAKISELLAGKRRINLNQARALALRFALPVDAFC